MGNIMAAALSKLFKENEDIVKAGHAAAESLVRGEHFCEQVTDITETGGGLRNASWQWRAEFRSLSDLRDFDEAVTLLLQAVLEK